MGHRSKLITVSLLTWWGLITLIVIPLDINECLVENAGCSHICLNTAGSFECECRRGYTLNVDTKSCDGEHNIHAHCHLGSKITMKHLNK